MNEQSRFDSRRSDAIRAMLVETVDSTQTSRPRPRRRTLVAMAIAVVAAVLASGSIALAVGGQDWFGSPIPMLTPTPTATPTPTPTLTPRPSPTATSAAPQAAYPESIIPVGCADLLPDGTLGGTMQSARLGLASVQPFTPEYASVLQAGVLQCQWAGDFDAEGGLLTAFVSTDAAAGASDIESTAAAGAQSLAAGDASAVSCSGGSSCDASLVIGDYWVQYSLRQSSHLSVEQAIATMEQSASSFASALQQHPTPLPAWIPPVSPWASTGDCAALTPETPMSDILGSPEMTGPTSPTAGPTPTVVENAQAGRICRWGVPDGLITPAGQIRSLEVQLAPGAAWVADDDVFAYADSTPVEIEGADAAYVRCAYSEGELCWLDVFVDNSWMQLGYPDRTAPENTPLLQAAAEAIIARR